MGQNAISDQEIAAAETGEMLKRPHYRHGEEEPERDAFHERRSEVSTLK